MVKQSDIAKMLNISRTTVARALNGTGSIHPDTKRKILELCDELGYERNPISTSLALKKEKNIYAFIIRTRNTYYTKEIIKGLKAAEEELRIYKYKLNIIETYIDNPMDQVEKLKEVLDKKLADGIIITPLLKEEIKEIKSNNKTVFFLSLDLPLDSNTISVFSDYYKIGRIVGNMLANSLNHGDKVLLIDTEDDRMSSRKSFQGVYDKLKETKYIDIVGPIYVSSLENKIEETINSNFSKDIKAIFSSRFLDKVVQCLIENEINNLKIVSNGFSEKICDFIKEDIVMAAIIQNYYNMAYMAAKISFEYLYKGIEPVQITNEYECKIILKENLYF